MVMTKAVEIAGARGAKRTLGQSEVGRKFRLKISDPQRPAPRTMVGVFNGAEQKPGKPVTLSFGSPAGRSGNDFEVPANRIISANEVKDSDKS